MVWAWVQTFKNRVCDDFAPATCDLFVDHMLAASEQTWGVWRDGDLGGMISFRPVTPLLGMVHCLFKRGFWGHSTTLPAMRLVLDEIFAGTTTKITASVFADNAQIRALLRELGTEDEGTLRAHTTRNGQLTDMVLVALFKEKYAANGNRSGDLGSGGHRLLAHRGIEEDHHLTDTDLHDGTNVDAARPI